MTSHLLEAIDVVGPERAFRAALDAARHAAETFAFEDVIAIVGRATAMIGPASVDRRLRAEGLVLAGEPHMRTGSNAEGRAATVEAAAIAKSLADGVLLARAALASGAEIAVAHVDGTLMTLLGDALELLPETEAALRHRSSLAWPARSSPMERCGRSRAEARSLVSRPSVLSKKGLGPRSSSSG